MVGGDLGHGVGLVQNHEVVGEEDAAGGLAFGGSAAGVDVGEEQRVVDDDQVGRADPGAGALVGAFLAVAVLARTAGGVGVDQLPDFGERRGVELMAQPLGGGLGPSGDTLQLLVLGGGEKLVFVAQGGGQTRGAQVVALADQHGGFERGVGLGFFGGGKHPAAQGQVFLVELFLEGDRVGGDDHLPRLVHGVDDAGQEVGEGFADAGAGFEQERLVALHRGGDGAGHFLLLGTMFESEAGLQPAAGGKQLRGELRRARGGRRRRQSVGSVIAETDHGRGKAEQTRAGLRAQGFRSDGASARLVATKFYRFSHAG